MTRIDVPNYLTVKELMHLFHIPKTTAWRAKRRGYFIRGYHAPPMEYDQWPEIAAPVQDVYWSILRARLLTDLELSAWFEEVYRRSARIAAQERPRAYLWRMARRLRGKKISVLLAILNRASQF